MSKKASESREDQTSHEAIKPQKFKDLDAKVANAEKLMSDGRDRKSELIANAVENDKLHKGAYGVFRKLRKMDPVAREAFRFNFEIYCEREWGKNTDFLRVTGEQPPAAGTPDGEEDVRPRHLRQPNASAADAVKDLAAKSGAKRADEENITHIGRGKPN